MIFNKILYSIFTVSVISIFIYFSHQKSVINKLEKDNTLKTIENQAVKEDLTTQQTLVVNYKTTSKKLNEDLKKIESKKQSKKIEVKDTKSVNKSIECQIKKIKDYEIVCK